MKVIAPADVYLPAVGAPVRAGQVVDVDDSTAGSLIDQGWATPATDTSSSPRPRPRSRATEKE